MKILLYLRNLIRGDKQRNEAREALELHKKTLHEIEKTAAVINEMNETLVKATTAYKIYKATGRKKKV